MDILVHTISKTRIGLLVTGLIPNPQGILCIVFCGISNEIDIPSFELPGGGTLCCHMPLCVFEPLYLVLQTRYDGIISLGSFAAL